MNHRCCECRRHIRALGTAVQGAAGGIAASAAGGIAATTSVKGI